MGIYFCASQVLTKSGIDFRGIFAAKLRELTGDHFSVRFGSRAPEYCRVKTLDWTRCVFFFAALKNINPSELKRTRPGSGWSAPAIPGDPEAYMCGSRSFDSFASAALGHRK
jgi:hypothetical protein